MENDKREYKERKPSDKQIFYFNEKGQLVVESNRGVWVDGEKFVKMYGDFVCNAKTMGIIIERFKGLPVVVAETTKNTYHDFWQHCVEETTSAIVNPTEEDKCLLEKIERYNIRNENMNEQVKQLREELNMHKDMSYKLQENIHKFNKLPWWKRMFKKVEV